MMDMLPILVRKKFIPVKKREISIFDSRAPSRFDTQFACLSKYNPEHANSFNMRDFSLFLSLLISNIYNIIFTVDGTRKDHIAHPSNLKTWTDAHAPS